MRPIQLAPGQLRSSCCESCPAQTISSTSLTDTWTASGMFVRMTLNQEYVHNTHEWCKIKSYPEIFKLVAASWPPCKRAARERSQPTPHPLHRLVVNRTRSRDRSFWRQLRAVSSVLRPHCNYDGSKAPGSNKTLRHMPHWLSTVRERSAVPLGIQHSFGPGRNFRLYSTDSWPPNPEYNSCTYIAFSQLKFIM